MNFFQHHILFKNDRNTNYLLVFVVDAGCGIAFVRVYDQDAYQAHTAGGKDHPYMYCTIGDRTFDSKSSISIDDARNVWYDAIREGWTRTKELVNA